MVDQWLELKLKTSFLSNHSPRINWWFFGGPHKVHLLIAGQQVGVEDEFTSLISCTFMSLESIFQNLYKPATKNVYWRAKETTRNEYKKSRNQAHAFVRHTTLMRLERIRIAKGSHPTSKTARTPSSRPTWFWAGSCSSWDPYEWMVWVIRGTMTMVQWTTW